MRIRSTHEWALKPIVLTTAIAALLLLQTASVFATELKVALYPDVPRLQEFKTEIRAAWKKVRPDVTLNFSYAETSTKEKPAWDGGYHHDPDSEYDVFVFDGMFFEYFRSKRYLETMAPGEVQNADDFLDYARAGVQVDGQYYAIPLLGCANILFFNKNDAAVANATSLSQLRDALGQCRYTSEIPPDRRGLMINMQGSTTNGALYLDAAHSIDGTYPLPQPPSPNQLKSAAIDNMRAMMSIASYRNATDELSGAYERGYWFDQGYGRAFVGFTEAMSVMDRATLNNIGFRVMPLSDDTRNRPLFYADVIGVNTTTASRGTRKLSVQLANIIASSQTMVDIMVPEEADQNPQYLMVARKSAFKSLAAKYPIYQRMYDLVTANDPLMFKLDGKARTWLNDLPAAIKQQTRANYMCGCDVDAVQEIANNAAAPAICQATCSAHGGWNGQWTNEYPAAMNGSVCGCNVCSVPQ